MTAEIRLNNRLRVLAKFLEHGSEELAGADLIRLTGLASGSLYPVLVALEQLGILESRWELDEPRDLRRPRRRLYKLTAAGELEARETAAALAPFARLAGLPTQS
jgi:PadR family transcriptional regulator, regulatory protein PadR